MNLLLRLSVVSVDDVVYSRLRERCGLFKHFIGTMQPVLAEARKMLLGQEKIIPFNLLAQLARQIEGDDLRNETYVQTDVVAGGSTTAALSRHDLRSAIHTLSEAGIDTERDEESGLLTIDGPDFARVLFATDGPTLDQHPNAVPLTPLSPEVRRLADAVDRGGEHLPLVVGAHQAGPFRIVLMRWIDNDGAAIEIQSFGHLQRLIAAWDASPLDTANRLRVEKDLAAEAARLVEAMQRRATQRVQEGLADQTEAARVRLLREVGRNLVITGAKPNSMNQVWHQLASRSDARTDRMKRCYNRLGAWPEWTRYGYLLDEIRDYVDDLSESRRDTRDQLGSEIDAALNDPRWTASQN